MTLAGFRQSQHDHSLFIHNEEQDITLLIVYVDDIIITGSNEQCISDLKLSCILIYKFETLAFYDIF